MNPNRAVVLALAVATASVGCQKSAERERAEADKAAAEAEKTAIEEHRKAAERTNKKTLEAMEEENDFLAAVRREQLDLRGRVQEEIDSIDRKLMNYRVEHSRDGELVIPEDAKDRPKIDALISRRAVLEEDADAIDDSSPDDWERVKRKVENDLGSRTLRGRI